MNQKSAYTVTQVNSYIKNMFTQDFLLPSVFVKGEVSNCKYHSSGHIYFTLKDTKGTLACVMFANSRSGLTFQLAEGQQVVVGGAVDVYERDGKYQLYAKEISLAGAGQLYEKFEHLKKELEEMGLFAKEYKQNIPKYVKKLGVITAPTGAAIQDIITVTTRRNKAVQIILYPAIVQGEQAAESIIKGLRILEKMKVDVIIVGRGGGSIEDLWAFNEAAVAHAIFDCAIPIISAVGHETDITIADYVADLRAATPSAAAEIAIVEKQHLQEKIDLYKNTLDHLLFLQKEKQLNRIEQFKLKLMYLSPINQIREKRTRVVKLEDTLQNAMEKKIRTKRHQLEIYIEKWKVISPLEKLNQGYAFITDKENNMINDIKKIKIGDTVLIQIKNGSIKADVTECQEIRREI